MLITWTCVRGTVRSKHDQAKCEVLHALAAALPGNLELHEADLLREGSFDSIVEGAHYVFHTASPYFRTSDNPQQELVSPMRLADLIELPDLPLLPMTLLKP